MLRRIPTRTGCRWGRLPRTAAGAYRALVTALSLVKYAQLRLPHVQRKRKPPLAIRILLRRNGIGKIFAPSHHGFAKLTTTPRGEGRHRNGKIRNDPPATADGDRHGRRLGSPVSGDDHHGSRRRNPVFGSAETFRRPCRRVGAGFGRGPCRPARRL